MSNGENTTLQRIEGNLAQIKELLSGNPLDPKDGGIVGRQHEIWRKFQELEDLVHKYIWMGAGIAVLVSLLFATAGLLIEYHASLK